MGICVLSVPFHYIYSKIKTAILRKFSTLAHIRAKSDYEHTFAQFWNTIWIFLYKFDIKNTAKWTQVVGFGYYYMLYDIEIAFYIYFHFQINILPKECSS